MEAGEEMSAHYIRARVSEMASTELRPDAEIVEAIALRVVELLAGGAGASPSGLVDATAVARDLEVERDWVYAHANQLGAIRLGGPRGRLRFDLQVVRERLGGADAASWHPPRRAPRRSNARKKAGRLPLQRQVKSNSLQKAAGARANAPGLTPGGPPMQHNDNRVGRA